MFSVPAATTTAPASTRRSVAVGADVLDSFRLAVLDHDPLDARVGAQLEPAAHPGVVDVGVLRRLAGVRRAALEARAAAHAVRVRVRAHRLEVGAERAEARLDGAHALWPVVALAYAEPLLDAVVVRVEVGGAERRAPRAGDAARGVPLRVVLRVRAQRDLRVDRRRRRRRSGPRPAPTAPPAPPSISANRIGHQRSCVAFASQRVKSAAVLCGPTSSRSTLRPLSASSPATTPPPAPEPTTTTSNRSLIRSPGRTSPSPGAWRAEC